MFEQAINGGYVIGMVIGGIIAFILHIILAVKFARVADMKGYGNDSSSFLLCFFCGLPGYLYVIALPKKSANKAESAVVQDPAIDVENTPPL